MQYRLETREVH